MNAIDATDHVEVETSEASPSLCTVILDTNPRAWASIGTVLPLSKAVSNILVFLNANLAFSNANQVAVIAAHTNRARWLYPCHNPGPSAPKSSQDAAGANGGSNGNGIVAGADQAGNGEDVPMADAPSSRTNSANKYPQFAQIETAVLDSVKKLVEDTSEADLECTTTQLSGALTLALAHINKVSQSYTASKADATKPAAASAAGATTAPTTGLSASILVLSVSDSEPAQYIPTMNAVFAAAHAGIPIDVLSLSPSTIADPPKAGTQHQQQQSQQPASAEGPNSSSSDPSAPTTANSFLQQASHITNGIYLAPSHPHGLLTYLLFAHASADASARAALVPPTHHTVDFRAACFCHGRVVDTGFVCSVCLSIFCSVPDGADCLTCGTHLALGLYGAKPAVVPRAVAAGAKKKRKRIMPNGSVREETGSAAATPMR